MSEGSAPQLGSSRAQELDHEIEVLRANAAAWVGAPVSDRRALLQEVREAIARVAGQWVREACAHKGIPVDSGLAGEEWLTGPYVLLTDVVALVDLLERLEEGRGALDGIPARRLPNGQIALRTYPSTVRDRVLLGYSGDIWLRAGVTLKEARDGAARTLCDARGSGQVVLVLGAGNLASIPPLDALAKLFQEAAVVLIKLSPLHEPLQPILQAALAPLVERGFVRIVTGDAEVGAYLAHHPGIDAIHITGSRATHDAIVFGPSAAGARPPERRPLLTKPITSDLGGVGPVIVVPGRWSEADLRRQAQHVATQRLHNSGFNCVATQIVVLPQQWSRTEAFLEHLREAIRAAPPRPAYYPGAAQRHRDLVDQYQDAETLGGDPSAPRTLLLGLDPEEPDQPAFRDECFAPVLGVTRLPGDTATRYLEHAVAFCNTRLAGDLGAGVIASPSTIRSLGPRFGHAVSRLRYGAVAVNCWVGALFGMPRQAWGAYPGHDVHDVGSGVGIVHNALLLDPAHVERSVGRGPFRPWPTPAWYVTNRTSHRTAGHLTRFAAEPSLLRALPAGAAAFVSSLRG